MILLLFQFCHKLKMVEEVKDTIFVGGIPYDMTLEEFEEEVQIWGKKIITGLFNIGLNHLFWTKVQ